MTCAWRHGWRYARWRAGKRSQQPAPSKADGGISPASTLLLPRHNRRKTTRVIMARLPAQYLRLEIVGCEEVYPLARERYARPACRIGIPRVVLRWRAEHSPPSSVTPDDHCHDATRAPRYFSPSSAHCSIMARTRASRGAVLLTQTVLSLTRGARLRRVRAEIVSRIPWRAKTRASIVIVA